MNIFDIYSIESKIYQQERSLRGKVVKSVCCFLDFFPLFLIFV